VDGIIDSACVFVDDRTADHTRDACFAAWSDLPGGFHLSDFAFEDFSQARNALLGKARLGLQPADYMLLLDPDSLPQGELPADEDLVESVYGCEWRHHGSVWHRVILVRGDQPAIYDGAVHEVINTLGAPMHVLPGVWVDAVVTADAERLEFIASVLRRDAAINPRSAFYLAQTLRDLGRRDEAFGWFMRRAAMGEGWAEETYHATLQAGLILATYDYELAAELWRRCLKIRQRSEAVYYLARQANQRGYHSEALSWASFGLQMGASNDNLFVNRWIESEGLMEQFNEAAQGLMPPASVAEEASVHG
jgi:tetratricopeptide (TPR) repeat protein